MVKANKHSRKKIAKSKRRAIWVKYIGEYIFKAKCLCCNSKNIDPFDFEAGHIKAHSKGGTDDIKNLVPICSICNKDMGDQNLKIFMRKIFKQNLSNVLKKISIINKKAKNISDI